MHALNRRLMLTTTIGGLAAAALPIPALAQTTAPADTEWRSYGNDLAHTRHAPLDQINGNNFNKLEVAWEFSTKNLGPRAEVILQGTPLLIKGKLYCTAGARRDVVCLDAATGELLWLHKAPDEGARVRNAPRRLSGRGVGYWTDGTIERIIYVTIGYQMVALDARTGLMDLAFGVHGMVDLKKEIDQDLDPEKADIGLHTAPTIANDVIIIGAAHTAGNTPAVIKNARGYVRGYDVKTGKRLWIFHTIPHKGEFGYDTWAPGTAEEAGNTGAWAQISADEELGLAYLGVEMPTGDQMGFYRPGNNLFAESIVAVDTRTGKRRWHYQMVHHGLWDYDVPCAAILCDIPHNGRIIKALAQPTKQSWLFVLDRETGKPVWPIPEKRVPAGDVPGEWYSKTQPHPSKPPPFDRQGFGADDIVDFTPEIKERALKIASYYKWGPVYTAPIMPKKGGPYGVINMPGYIGGINWPGGAYDPVEHTVYTYSQTNLLTIGNVIPNPDKKMGEFSMVHVNPPADTPGVRPGDLTVDGIPLVKPPYGRITATNLATGTQSWQTVHGETPDNIRNHPLLKGVKIPRTGMIGKVGPLSTKSLVICGDPMTYTDETGRVGARLRAYDKKTGEEKGAVFIPGEQTGSPMTYMLGGRQYIVLAIGGRSYNGAFIAFRLPA
jgi:quinoprotein glucose dehydrogenase